MHRASAETTFTWHPFNDGRQRRAAVLVAVALSSGLVGLAVGVAASGADVKFAPARALREAVLHNDQNAPSTAPVMMRFELNTGEAGSWHYEQERAIPNTAPAYIFRCPTKACRAP